MKLSKEELIDLLYGVGTDWGPSEYVYRAERVIEAIKTNTLEIEGYERTEWTKFDPSDEATYPPGTGGYIVALDGFAFAEEVAFYESYNAFDTDEVVTHWRPLPPPPEETEEAK